MTISEQQQSNNTRFEALERRMDKYDEIIDELKEIVISIKSSSEATARTHKAWISGILICLTAGATIIGGLVTALAGHLIH